MGKKAKQLKDDLIRAIIEHPDQLETRTINTESVTFVQPIKTPKTFSKNEIINLIIETYKKL